MKPCNRDGFYLIATHNKREEWNGDPDYFSEWTFTNGLWLYRNRASAQKALLRVESVTKAWAERRGRDYRTCWRWEIVELGIKSGGAPETHPQAQAPDPTPDVSQPPNPPKAGTQSEDLPNYTTLAI